MALFSQNEELSRQGQRIPFERVQGLNKGLMSVLGYQDTGELNKWGKVIGGGGIMGNIYARGLSKGTDANTVIRQGTDEALNQTLQTAALGINIAKAAGGGGSFGAASAGSGLLSKMKEKQNMKEASKGLDDDVSNSDYVRNISDPTDVLNFNSPEEFAKHWQDKGFTVDPATNQILNEDGSIYTYDPENPPHEMLGGDTGMMDTLTGEDVAESGIDSLKNILTGDVMGSATSALASRKGYSSSLKSGVDKINYRKDLDTLNYL